MAYHVTLHGIANRGVNISTQSGGFSTQVRGLSTASLDRLHETPTCLPPLAHAACGYIEHTVRKMRGSGARLRADFVTHPRRIVTVLCPVRTIPIHKRLPAFWRTFGPDELPYPGKLRPGPMPSPENVHRPTFRKIVPYTIILWTVWRIPRTVCICSHPCWLCRAE